jgi:hypothetical protein
MGNSNETHSGTVDVLEVLASWCSEKNIGREEYARRSSVYAAVAGLIEAADQLLSATGIACSSWPLGSPKRVAFQRLNSAVRSTVGADPHNGTTAAAVAAALAAIGPQS